MTSSWFFLSTLFFCIKETNRVSNYSCQKCALCEYTGCPFTWDSFPTDQKFSHIRFGDFSVNATSRSLVQLNYLEGIILKDSNNCVSHVGLLSFCSFSILCYSKEDDRLPQAWSFPLSGGWVSPFLSPSSGNTSDWSRSSKSKKVCISTEGLS